VQLFVQPLPQGPFGKKLDLPGSWPKWKYNKSLSRKEHQGGVQKKYIVQKEDHIVITM
jgi:hypothetical protein